MKQTILLLFSLLLLCNCEEKKSEIQTVNPATVCNPMNINYRFCLDQPSRREAADPTVVRFKEKYYLFASKSGGYWYSDNLVDWSFVVTAELPLEDYAPTAVVIGDTLYFMASSHAKNKIFKTANPISGKWEVAAEEFAFPAWDPCLFLDDDKRLYLYWGCSDKNPIYGVELDYKNRFAVVGETKALLYPDTINHGWEVPGDYNTKRGQAPWIEGAWMNKYKDTYYLQYSGPGTEFKSYSDAVYTSKNPLGPYVLAVHNPFSYKPEGFIAGAGHGSTFEDAYGNFWHIGTGTISIKHMFERRLILSPVFFDEGGNIHAVTRFGDYPMVIPNQKIKSYEELFRGWMLLSYKKKVEVSSAIDTLPASYMNDEDIRTYWAAKTGNVGEYAVMDLGRAYDVYALQLNFAEHATEILGRQKELFHRYSIEYSSDSTEWKMLTDKSKNENDNSHDYIELSEKVNGRYLRIKNIQVPGGNFAMSGFRVFGKGNGEVPNAVTNLNVVGNVKDKRSVKLTWEKSEGATGYMVSYGMDEKKLYQSYMVYSAESVLINSLKADQSYFFTVEPFNENGVGKSSAVVKNTQFDFR